MSARLKKTMLAASVCFAALLPGLALAQEAVIVLNQNEVGAPTYNPIKSSVLNVATKLIFDTLVAQDAELGYHPQLAESWEEAADGMSWTFKLKPGVTFHNGEPFNAETIKAWLPLFAGTENEYMVGAIDHVEVVDELTAKLVMKRPEPNMLYNLSSVFMGVPEPKAFAEMGDDFGVTDAVGTGPFRLETFDIGQETVLVRNEDYTWGTDLATNTGPAKMERLTFREIAEASTAFLELKTGGVDILMSVPSDFLGELAKEPDIGVLTLPGQEVIYMPMNVTKEPFTDIRVREAAALAVNQQEILETIYGGVGATADTLLISALPESKVADQYKIKYNPERSAALLDEAGWVMGTDGVRAKDGKPLSVSLWTQSDTAFRRLSEVVQAELKAVGIAAELTTFDSSAIRDQYKTGEQQIAVRSYLWDNADIVDWFFGGDRLGYPNVSMFNDPKAEELRAIAMTGSKNSAERAANFITYHEYVLSQFPFAPIYQPVQNIGFNKTRLKLPEPLRSPQFNAIGFMDLDVVE